MSHDEPGRLAAVRRYEILDTPPDGAFDRVCAIAARVFEVPFSTVSVVDEDRIWFKARHGIEAPEIPREPGLCASAILQDGPYVIPDTRQFAHVAGNALVRGALGIRCYAGAPITTPDGWRLGTVNVLDVEPRSFTDAQADTLLDLAAIVADQLEVRLEAIRAIRALGGA